MKQLTIILLTLFFAFTLASCNKNSEEITDSPPESLNTPEETQQGEEDEIDNYDEGEVIEGEIDEDDMANEFDDLNELDEKEELLQLPGDDAYEPFPTD